MSTKAKRIDEYIRWIDMNIQSNNVGNIDNETRFVSDPPNDQRDDQEFKPRADVVIIHALENPEQKTFLKIIEKGIEGTFYDVVIEGSIFKSLIYNVNGKRISVFFGLLDSMGMTSASVLTSKAIFQLQPKLVIMTGICAGIQSKAQLGDIVIANPVYDYGAGKYSNGVFLPSYSQFRLQNRVESICNLIKADHAFRERMLSSWETDEGLPLRRGDIQILSGALGTGASVIADNDIVESLKLTQRNIIAIDMEAYGVAYSATKTVSEEIPWLVVKGVQDYADATKDDDCRQFAAHMSAFFAFEFIKRFFALEETADK